MKRFAVLAVMVAVARVSGMAANMHSDDPRFTDQKLKVIEVNLRLALESGNYAIQASAAQVVRQVKALVPTYEFSTLVTPLMRISNDERSQPQTNRIVTALALHDLVGDSVVGPPPPHTDRKQVRIGGFLTH